MSVTARTHEELMIQMHAQLDNPEMQAILRAVGLKRRVDITLFLDRGVVSPKPPTVIVS